MGSRRPAASSSALSGRTSLIALLAVACLVAAWVALRQGEGGEPDAQASRSEVESSGSSGGFDVDPAPDKEGRSTIATNEAASPPVETAAQPILGSATLHGVILDPAGLPPTGAHAALGGVTRLGFIRSGKEPPESGVAAADEQGRFSLEVKDYPLELTALAPGFASSETLILREPPADDAAVVLRLRPACSISGHVYRPDGTTIPGRRVRFMRSRGPNAPVGRPQVHFETTDERGAFHARDLDPGRWDLLTSPARDEVERGDFGTFTGIVQGGVELEAGEAAMVDLGAPSENAVTVHGVVTMGGKPSPGGLLQWMREGGGSFADEVYGDVDAGGEFDCELTGPGAWYVRYMGGGERHAEQVVVVPAAEAFRVEISIPLGRIEGVVVDADGRPVPGATVTPLVGGGTRPRGSLRVMDDTVSTDENGAFALSGLDAGTYTVGAESKERGAGAAHGIKLTEGGTIAGITVVLGAAGRIRGHIRDQRGLDARTCAIWFFDASGRVVNPISNTRTDGEGRFEGPLLAAGVYRVLARTKGGAVMSGAVTVPPAGSGHPAPLELRLGEGGILVARIEDRGEGVRGHVVVRDAGGRQLSGLRVAWNPHTCRDLPLDSVNRHFGPLPAGDVRVQGWVDGHPGPEASATVIAGEQVTVELAAP